MVDWHSFDSRAECRKDLPGPWPPVDNQPPDVVVLDDPIEPQDRIGRLRGRSAGSFRLDQCESSITEIEEEIYFQSLSVTEVIK